MSDKLPNNNIGEALVKTYHEGVVQALADNAVAIKVWKKIKDRVPPSVVPCYNHSSDYYGNSCIFFDGTCSLFNRYIRMSKDLPDMCTQFFKEAGNENTK